jgi:hypothetical protein
MTQPTPQRKRVGRRANQKRVDETRFSRAAGWRPRSVPQKPLAWWVALCSRPTACYLALALLVLGVGRAHDIQAPLATHKIAFVAHLPHRRTYLHDTSPPRVVNHYPLTSPVGDRRYYVDELAPGRAKHSAPIINNLRAKSRASLKRAQSAAHTLPGRPGHRHRACAPLVLCPATRRVPGTCHGACRRQVRGCARWRQVHYNNTVREPFCTVARHWGRVASSS